MNALKVNDIVPKFSLSDLDCKKINLSDYQGQRVLIILTSRG